MTKNECYNYFLFSDLLSLWLRFSWNTTKHSKRQTKFRKSVKYTADTDGENERGCHRDRDPETH